ncbi:MAG: hypothetical protein M3Z57_00945 [Candidatus Dormibacteraeota bacterium]|nr:hypothetical protein [Candidatus Dormibacteraeota bacterium]
MIRARHAALVTVVGCGLLTSCGSTAVPSPTTSSASARATATPLGGTPLRTDKFTTVVPTNWSNKVDDTTEVAKFSGGGKVEMLIEQGPPGQVQQNINDVTANINVLVLASAVPADQVATYLQSVSNNGATNLSAAQSFTIDGATGQFITYDRDIQGTPGESQDMIINHGGSTYDIVLNTSQFAFSKQQSGLQAVLAAWHWNS